MNKQPGFRELLELPDNYVYKIIVNPSVANEEAILQTARETLARNIGKPTVRETPSKKGKYVSYTLRIYIETHDELEALYTGFKNMDGSVVVL